MAAVRPPPTAHPFELHRLDVRAVPEFILLRGEVCGRGRR
jgi:hypothetical protein